MKSSLEGKGSLPLIPPIMLSPCAAAGKASIPHRQLQEQAPVLSVEPVPATTLGDAGAAGATAAALVATLTAETAEVAAMATEVAAITSEVAAGGGGAAAAEAATGAAEAAPALEPDPACAMAAAWKSAWLFSMVGLMLKVMPLPQCDFAVPAPCLQ